MNGLVEHPELRAPAILAVLERHHVEYVVIGGFAAQLHGAVRPTFDIEELDQSAVLKPVGEVRVRSLPWPM